MDTCVCRSSLSPSRLLPTLLSSSLVDDSYLTVPIALVFTLPMSVLFYLHEDHRRSQTVEERRLPREISAAGVTLCPPIGWSASCSTRVLCGIPIPSSLQGVTFASVTFFSDRPWTVQVYESNVSHSSMYHFYLRNRRHCRSLRLPLASLPSRCCPNHATVGIAGTPKLS
ncbi:hypothetical protein QCA50_013581 [Cerrena zonata]|uniref:Uncharacterized protein n=1 Tax=Cerrena zonata TaxID=2478898 RepID=A0AAW0FYQ0_9APHY